MVDRNCVAGRALSRGVFCFPRLLVVATTARDRWKEGTIIGRDKTQRIRVLFGQQKIRKKFSSGEKLKKLPSGEIVKTSRGEGLYEYSAEKVEVSGEKIEEASEETSRANYEVYAGEKS